MSKCDLAGSLRRRGAWGGAALAASDEHRDAEHVVAEDVGSYYASLSSILIVGMVGQVGRLQAQADT